MACAAEMFGLSPDQCFCTSEAMAQRPAFADVAINGTMDRQHVPTTLPLLGAGYDVLLEKPIAPTRGGCCSRLCSERAASS